MPLTTLPLCLTVPLVTFRNALEIGNLVKGLDCVLKCHPFPARIEKVGKSLVLWCLFPPKDGKGKHRQQKLSLGVKATVDGLRSAQQTAFKIQRELEEGTFKWSDYGRKASFDPEQTKTILGKFKDNFSLTEFTWKGAYQSYINRLVEVQNERKMPFGCDLFLAVLESYEPKSASIKDCGTVLRKLAEQENIVLPKDFSKLCRGYKIEKGAKTYPKDNEILDFIERFQDPHWKWVFGMMATYGLRSHEPFFCDTDDLLKPDNKEHAITVNSLKTGIRKAFPLHPEWVDRFGLKHGSPPVLNLRGNRRYSKKYSNPVSKMFKRLEIGYVPTELRHAYAIRSIGYDISITNIANSMGHHELVHLGTYRFHIDEYDQRKAFANAKPRGA